MIHAAEDHDAGQAGEDAEQFGIFMNLHGEFAGGSEDEGAGAPRFAFTFERMIQESGKERQQKRGGFSGTGLRFSGEVATFQQGRQRHRLDGGAVAESGVLNAELNFRMKRKVEEPGFPFGGFNLVEGGGMFRNRSGRSVGGFILRFATLGVFAAAIAGFSGFFARFFGVPEFLDTFGTCLFFCPSLRGGSGAGAAGAFILLLSLGGSFFVGSGNDDDGAAFEPEQTLESFFERVQHNRFTFLVSRGRAISHSRITDF